MMTTLCLITRGILIPRKVLLMTILIGMNFHPKCEKQLKNWLSLKIPGMMTKSLRNAISYGIR